MKIWALRFLAGAAALFLAAAPVEVDFDEGSVGLGAACAEEGRGCKLATGWWCEIRHGKDDDVILLPNSCNVGEKPCDDHEEGGAPN